MNQPYVKQFNKDGTIKNPIRGGYFSSSDNRRQRRKHLNTPPFTGCGNNYPIVVVGIGKFLKTLQLAANRKTGIIHKIYHYLPQ